MAHTISSIGVYSRVRAPLAPRVLRASGGGGLARIERRDDTTRTRTARTGRVIANARPWRALLALAMLATYAACARLPTEGEVCDDSICADGLACVVDVGSEYGFAASDDVCERPRAIYSFIAYGERGENRRVDEALAMIDGTYRMPRFGGTSGGMVTMSHAMPLADGSPLQCTGLSRGKPRDCLVPDWTRYLGTELEQYDRFYFFGLRMLGSVIYTAFHSPAKRLAVQYHTLTGKWLDRDGIAWLRAEARHLALAMVDSFVASGHRPFALDRMPACYTGDSGYQNPNAVWAPHLAHWDPAMRLGNGRLATARDVPADCTGAIPHTYYTLRDSLWYPHGVAFRALVLANSYYLYRGMLPPERRDAWLQVVRETGDALALPSSYEPNQNHGVTESAALMQLGSDFASLLPPEVTTSWLELGRYRLNDLIVDTVFADGVQVEQSPMYHNYQTVLLLQILSWMEAHELDLVTGIDPAAPIDYDTVAPAPTNPAVTGLSPSPALDARAVVDNMVRASVHLAQHDGWIPLIGSSAPQDLRRYQVDVFSSYISDERPFAPLLRFFRTGGTEGTAPPDAARLSVFEDSGFAVMHSAFKPDFAKQTHVVFSTGMPYNRHSHPEALAVHLFGPDTTPGAKTGTPLLVDSGWYSYESIGTNYFKSTLAHNTVNIDGKNQCVRDPAHMRLDPYVDGDLPSCAELAELEPGAGVVTRGQSLQGTWNGTSWLYQSARNTLYFGTTHRRAVLLVGRDILIVLDILDSNAAHTFSQTWHLAPRIPPLAETPKSEGGTYHIQFPRSADDPGPLLSLHEATDGAELVLHYGDPPIGGVYGQGWYSEQENDAEPKLVVELRRTGVASTAFASVFLLGSRAGEHADVTLRKGSASAGGVTVQLPDATLTFDVENLADASAELVRVH